MDLTTDKNILVVGPGALGTLFAARLGQKYRRLWVLDYKESRAAQLQERGFHVTGATSADWTPPDGHVGVETRGWPDMDVVLFLVKALSLKAAVSRAKPVIASKTASVFLQNGWGTEEGVKKRVSRRQRVLGITHEAATLESVGHVFHAAAGATLLDAESPPAKPVARIFAEAGLAVRLEKNFEKERWMKLVINACLNPLGALAEAPNGRLVEAPLADLLDRVVEECVRLSVALKRPMNLAEARRRVEAVAARTAANRNSLWQDLSRGRPTERDFLLGPFLEASRRRRVPAPALTFLDRLLRRVEKFAESRRP